MKSIYLANIFANLLFWNLTFSIAQTTDYTWDEYGLKFSVPVGFEETANDETHFEGKCEKSKIILFGLYPIKSNQITKSNLKDAFNSMTKEANMTVDEIQNISFNGFEGIYAEGKINNVEAFFACMLDPMGDLNFIVSVLHDNVDAAVKIVKSIKKVR
ncbi:MAG: hypothetical protein NZ551_03730 [Microscillaceae bacterium]|nr:hypothetical protein [Microscillaceae bacterium]MDW8460299.1 hypothetical protein [Cytophagales bacterium]